MFVGLLKIIRNVAGARLKGDYKDNPFFVQDSGMPAERQALDGPSFEPPAPN